MPAPLLLLPPSKGKAEGDHGPAYVATLTDDHPLAAPRREVLAAVEADAPQLDDRTLARTAGVAARDVDDVRARLAALGQQPTLAARLRYRGVVHGNARLADRAPATLGCEVRIVSPLLGLVAPHEPTPNYRLELATLPTLGGLGPYWRRRLADHVAELGAGRRVWDLLPGEHRRVWDPEVRAELDVLEASFLRPDGRAANAARTKVAKGAIAAALLEAPHLPAEEVVARAELDPGWTVTVDGTRLLAVYGG